MKLIIQIPCYNEAQSLPVTLAELPRKVLGFGLYCSTPYQPRSCQGLYGWTYSLFETWCRRDCEY